jgi:hypothetical protein
LQVVRRFPALGALRDFAQRGFKAGPMLGLIRRQTQLSFENGNARITTISALAYRGGRPFSSGLPTLRAIGQRNEDRRRHAYDREAWYNTIFHGAFPFFLLIGSSSDLSRLRHPKGHSISCRIFSEPLRRPPLRT